RDRTCPFIVLIDHREQLPYSFADLPPKAAWRGRLIVPTERITLVTGDYTICGLEDRFSLERKELSDLFGTIGQARQRFEAELERLNAMEFAAVIVEATLREAWNPAAIDPEWRSRLSPRSVEGSIVAWEIRYPRVHWWHVGDRRAGEVRAFEAMEQFWKAVQHAEKAKEQAVRATESVHDD
ncbi:MAG TPA: ERCC4 domain-containing protein, partial [Pirellulales bacterium]|nr:ERCC4 domain-containing protein [Pirellulales bacterium]